MTQTNIFANQTPMWIPHCGLYSVRLDEVPTIEEWQQGCNERIIYHQEAFKKVAKIRSKAGKAAREHHEKMIGRWKRLRDVPKVKIDCLREYKSQGKPLEVYF